MAKLCVEIEFDTETGQYTVEKCEPKEEIDEGEMQGMQGNPMISGQAEQMEGGEQSFQSLDQALQAAKQILQQTPDNQAMSQERGEIAKEVWPQQKPMMQKGMP